MPIIGNGDHISTEMRKGHSYRYKAPNNKRYMYILQND